MRSVIGKTAIAQTSDVTTALALVALSLLTTAIGCQSFAPTGFGAARMEKKIRQQAELDPFPSPEDVGLGAQSEKK